jgi:hypothetical protein
VRPLSIIIYEVREAAITIAKTKANIDSRDKIDDFNSGISNQYKPHSIEWVAYNEQRALLRGK